MAAQVGGAFSSAGDANALGFGVGFFFDGIELGIQRTKVSSDLDDDDLTAYAGYFLGYLVRPNEERRESVAVGPFVESVSDGRRSVVIGGVQLVGSQQVYSSGSFVVAPEISVAIGLGLENYEGPPITGASLSLGLAVGTVRTAFLVIDPTVSVSGQDGGFGFGVRVSGIVPFRGGT